MSRKATRAGLKEHNRHLILSSVFDGSATSRVELSQYTGLAKPTVSDIVGNLIDEGFLIETGRGESTESGGKLPHPAATAAEISLKIKELTYISGEGYSEADFRHGPIATIMRGFPVILVAPRGYTLPRMRELVSDLGEKGAELLIISNDDAVLDRVTRRMPIPDVPEWRSPILAVVPGQVFAMHQALVRGYAADRPRGLHKVTVTE